MRKAELNHLRRLVAWVRCEIGQDPAEMVAMLGDIADKLGHPEIDDAARQRLVEGYDKARAAPLYVRAAVKSLQKYLNEPGQVVEADPRALGELTRLSQEARMEL